MGLEFPCNFLDGDDDDRMDGWNVGCGMEMDMDMDIRVRDIHGQVAINNGGIAESGVGLYCGSVNNCG